MKKALVEFIGTFFLVFTIGCTVVAPNAGDFAPIAIGAVLMVMVFAGGHLSGAHYNPAVSLAVFIRGKLPAKDLIIYWAAQFLAAGVAACFIHMMKPAVTVEPGLLGRKAGMIAEALFTFALCWVVLNVATSKGTAGNSFYGVAIGMTVTAGAFAVGGISGAAFNPAVAVGVTLMHLSAKGFLWVLVTGEIVGAVGAAIAYKLLHPADTND